jgi:DNA-binding protein Fis
MSRKQILFIHEDASLQKHLERHLDGVGSLVSIQSMARKKRRDGLQPFPLVIIESGKDWHKNVQRFRRLNGVSENPTIVIASSSLIQQHADSLRALSQASFGEARPSESGRGAEKSPEDLSLNDFVERKLRNFVKHMKVAGVRNLYSMLLSEVERPLITYILKETNGNQIRAAQLMGVNRNTLRKKMKALAIHVKPPSKTRPRK